MRAHLAKVFAKRRKAEAQENRKARRCAQAGWAPADLRIKGGSGFAAHEEIATHRSNSNCPADRISPAFRDRVVDSCGCRADNHF
jgi:hypothetical protein